MRKNHQALHVLVSSSLRWFTHSPLIKENAENIIEFNFPYKIQQIMLNTSESQDDESGLKL